MTHAFQIPSTINTLRSKADLPYEVGLTIGELLYNIAPLVSYHLDQHIDFDNKPPRASILTLEFTAAIDALLVQLRTNDSLTVAYSSENMVDRKTRKKRRQYQDRYTLIAEKAFKDAVRKELGDMFAKWSAEQTAKFNKGVDRGLTGTAWCVYPEVNVVVEVGEGDWAVWLKGKCEELGLVEAKAGRRVLDDL